MELPLHIFFEKSGAAPIERVLYFLLHNVGGSGSLSSTSGGLLSTSILVPVAVAVGMDEDSPVAVGTDKDSSVAVGTDEDSPLAVGMDEDSPVAVGTDKDSPLAVGMDEDSPLAVGKDEDSPLAVGTDEDSVRLDKVFPVADVDPLASGNFSCLFSSGNTEGQKMLHEAFQLYI